MLTEKFMDLPHEQQMEQVKNRFQCKDDAGWFTPEGFFAGKTATDVIAALIELEDAEINAIGDCMSGCCMLTPKLADFVRKS
jgi:hypothetical protein